MLIYVSIMKKSLFLFKDDSSGSLGRRYARTDAIGIPFGITVDFESSTRPWSVTLRYSPTMEQVRLNVSICISTISVCGKTVGNPCVKSMAKMLTSEGKVKVSSALHEDVWSVSFFRFSSAKFIEQFRFCLFEVSYWPVRF